MGVFFIRDRDEMISFDFSRTPGRWNARGQKLAGEELFVIDGVPMQNDFSHKTDESMS